MYEENITALTESFTANHHDRIFINQTLLIILLECLHNGLEPNLVCVCSIRVFYNHCDALMKNFAALIQDSSNS